MSYKNRILVIDDDREVCEVVAEMLAQNSSYNVTAESDPAKALELVKSRQFDLVLTDLMLRSISGMEVMEAVLEHNADAIVILMTGYPTVENAIEALKQGAYDFL